MTGMTVKDLIKMLEATEKKYGNIEVRVEDCKHDIGLEAEDLEYVKRDDGETVVAVLCCKKPF